MRPLGANGSAPLPAQEVVELLREHIPYRLAHLLDAIPRIPARNMADNQAFEAGAVAGRTLLSFLGVGYSNRTATLKEDRKHQTLPGGMTDDLKAPDVGGSFVEIKALSDAQQAVLARFIHGVHKSSAHFTWKSQHQLDVATYREAAEMIKNLLYQHVPSEVDKNTAHNAGWPLQVRSMGNGCAPGVAALDVSP